MKATNKYDVEVRVYVVVDAEECVQVCGDVRMCGSGGGGLCADLWLFVYAWGCV
jgi:hypothetical protein